LAEGEKIRAGLQALADEALAVRRRWREQEKLEQKIYSINRREKPSPGASEPDNRQENIAPAKGR
jgi:hypothetical protein